MDIKPIHTEADYHTTLREIDTLLSATTGSPEGDRLDVLVTLMEAYERTCFPMDLPDPIEAIKFVMDQRGLTPKDLEARHRAPEPRLRGTEAHPSVEPCHDPEAA